VGCLVAVILNADTFAVGRALWSDGTLRAQMVQVADATVKAGPPPNAAAGQNEQGPTADQITNRFKDLNTALRPLPIGWSFDANPPLDQRKADLEHRWLYWALKALGLFATGLALSFGAPFWFDALSKFMNLRAAGAKPERQT
jgi:hypothetical protein